MMKFRFIFMLVVAIYIITEFSPLGAMVLRTDTVFYVDTITTRETITRSEVIERTKKVVRYYENGVLMEKTLDGDSKEVEKGDGIPGFIEMANDSLSHGGSMIYVDTLYRRGGRYVWIPDSMNQVVKSLLTGEKIVQTKGSPSEDDVNLNEKVIFRGDTINMILKDRNLGRYDRGLFNYLFIPKGIWQVGLTASYGEFSTADLQILDLVSDVDFSGKLWSIKPYFSYFIRSNLSVGLRLSYTHGKAKIGSFNVDIDEDMSFNLHDIYYKSNRYAASVTLSQYLGIARKGRFGVFNEVELELSGGNSDFNRPYNGEIRKTHSTTFQTALNFSPGVCVYVLDEVSFNVSLGVFGLNIKHEKQKVDGEELGWRTTSGANFRFNIFNINFGIAVNI